MKFYIEAITHSYLTVDAENREELDKIINEMTDEELLDDYYIEDIIVKEEED